MRSLNRVELTVRLTQQEPLRHTPAGIPILHLALEHQSEVQEAGSTRTVALEMPAVALGDLAESLAGMERSSEVRVVGFLAPQRQGSNQLVLHLQSVAQAQ
ncbi:Primosomal replication protein N OS=Castellaniella defragrans OX=75697 GN=priB PE=3 SV=1 [Castellaniella defragrans]